MKSIKSWSLIWWKGTQNIYKFFLGLVWGCNVYILFASMFLQDDTLSLLFMFMHLSLLPIRIRVEIGLLVPSRPFWRWKWVLWVVKLLFKCLFFVNAVNSVGVVHWMWRWWLPSPYISSLLYLHISDIFHGALLFGSIGQLRHSRCAFIPQAPRMVGPSVSHPQTLVHVSGLDWCMNSPLPILGPVYAVFKSFPPTLLFLIFLEMRGNKREIVV